ncbi:jg4820 [Pararge aegeria aegeria]|uniref:Jg4820 protein n=1 Tax=Pararge aegeria aegeria TaxID=348720 RepID=A0A8S4SE74_9NEOP|nr:jg4820 [Pararge aegeria aegeria]
MFSKVCGVYQSALGQLGGLRPKPLLILGADTYKAVCHLQEKKKVKMATSENMLQNILQYANIKRVKEVKIFGTYLGLVTPPPLA